MNKKGFTLVEVIVSFVLVTAVSIALFRTTLSVQQRQKANIALNKFKALNLVLNNEIQYDFLTDRILSTSECDINCYDIVFENKGTVRITINREDGTIIYGSFKEKLPEEYTFYDDMTLTSYISNTAGLNSYFALNIPVKSSYESTLTNIKYMYQYDSTDSELEIYFTNIATTIDGDGLYLAGLMKTLANNGTIVSDPYSTVNNNIVHFKRATRTQYENIKNSLTTDNKVPTTGTKFDLYMWFSVDTIYYYTEAKFVELDGSMAKAFARMNALADISGLSSFKTTNITDMNRLFQDSKSLVDLSPISDWDVSNVTDMTFMFGANDGSMGINNLTPLADWDVSNVESFNQTFKRCSNITSLNPIANWNVSRVTNMTQMFNWCGLTDALDIIDWDVRAVTNFTKMLDNNSSLPNNKKPIFTLSPGIWDESSTYIAGSSGNAGAVIASMCTGTCLKVNETTPGTVNSKGLLQDQYGNYRYQGADPDNYVTFNGETAGWRIVGVFDGKVKLVKAASIGNYAYDTTTSDINSGSGINEWTVADINDTLNNEYYPTMQQSAKNLIYNSATWNLGGSRKETLLKNQYGNERGTNVVVVGITCSGNDCNDDVIRTTSWIGKVGLIYPSDFGYAASSGAQNYSLSSTNWGTNWMANYGWTITPHNVYARRQQVALSNAIGDELAKTSKPIHPCVYLKTNITISGNGTSSSPYVFTLVPDSNTEPTSAELDAIYAQIQSMDADVTNYENALTGVQTSITNLTNKNNSNNVFLKTYPVGSIYISNTNTNPGTVFGGTWVAFGTGRTIVGVDTSQAEFDTVEETGGEKTHTLTVSEIPSHSHSGIHWSTPTGKEWSDVNTSSSKDGYGLTISSSKISTTSWVTGNTGGGSAHNNLQPYITVYMWKRTG